ncbi:MAG: SIS domain-containing protein [Anaerolineae bacterium]|nr:SIS domain-containing protein [Anaerolineae bacterium]
MDKGILQYIEQLQVSLNALPIAEIETLVQVLLDARAQGKQVFVMGNGGSAATASHMACDLGKGASMPGKPRFKVIALTDNIPLITAWANDAAYEDIFVEQLRNLVQPGDVVIGFSGSGNSENVLRAMHLANEAGAYTVGLTGFDGGKLHPLVDLGIHVENGCMEQVEDIHLIIEHAIAVRLRECSGMK